MKLTNILLALVLAATQAHAANATIIWNNYKGNAAHTGYLDVKTDPTKFCLLWNKSFKHNGDNDDMYASQPILTSDMLYFSISDANNSCHYNGVYALNPATGEMIWQSPISDSTMLAGPVYEDGHLYLTRYKKDYNPALITALDAKTGVLQYATPATLPTPDLVITRPPVIFDHHIYIGTELNTGKAFIYNQYSFDAADGTLHWAQPAGDVQTDPTVSNDYIFRRNGAGIDVLNRHNSLDKFTIKAESIDPRRTDDTVLIWDEKRQMVYAVVYALNNNSTTPELTAFDIQHRQVKWKLPMSDEIKDMVLADNALYIFDNGHIYEVNPNTGKIARSTRVNNRIVNMIVTTDMIFIAGTSNLYAPSRQTLNEVWQTPIADDIEDTGYMAIDNNRLYLVSSRWSINLTAIAIN